MEAERDLARIAALPDSSARAAQYTSFLERAAAALAPDALLAFADHVASESTPPATAHALFAELAALLPTLPAALHKALAVRVLAALAHRVHSFESEIVATRLALAKVYEGEHEWTLAAQALAEIPFAGAARMLNDSFRVEQYVKIARYYIEDDNPVDAHTYTVRSSVLMRSCQDEGAKLMHKVSVARVLDAKRKFEDAAMKYYLLSQIAPGTYGAQEIGAGDAAQALGFAITCAILAPAGPRRSRVLAILYNDERSRGLDVFPLLESIHMGRLLKSSQVDAFRPTLRPHQVATDADGTTVLDRAVTEHNLLAASRLYTNIRFEALGAVLGVSTEKAEDVCQLMAYEGRMQARLDQVEGVVEFEAPGTRDELTRWDRQIEDLCAAVDGCCDAILKAYPQLAGT
jgi:COP9 signalosome complex subunit 4